MLIVTIAGLGQRFKKVGFSTPKYLLPLRVNNSTSILEYILNSLRKNFSDIEIRIVIGVHDIDFIEDIKSITSMYKPCQILLTPYLPGQSLSVLRAFDLSKPDHSFLVVNGDTLVSRYPSNESGFSNSIGTFSSNSPDYSYVAIDSLSNVVDIKEKVVISDYASSGIYSFNSRDSYISALCKCLQLNSGNEIYISEVIASLIKSGSSFDISSSGDVIDLGTPTKYSLHFNSN